MTLIWFSQKPYQPTFVQMPPLKHLRNLCVPIGLYSINATYMQKPFGHLLPVTTHHFLLRTIVEETKAELHPAACWPFP